MTWESNLRGSSAAFPLMGRLGRISTSLGVYNVPFKDLVRLLSNTINPCYEMVTMGSHLEEKLTSGIIRAHCVGGICLGPGSPSTLYTRLLRSKSCREFLVANLSCLSCIFQGCCHESSGIFNDFQTRAQGFRYDQDACSC